jgi:hypothetical protein
MRNWGFNSKKSLNFLQIRVLLAVPHYAFSESKNGPELEERVRHHLRLTNDSWRVYVR